MHRVRVAEGAWFTDADADAARAGVIVNEVFWKLLGSPPLSSHPTVTLPGSEPTTAVIIGVTPSAPFDEDYPAMFCCTQACDRDRRRRELIGADLPELRGVGAARAGRRS